MSYHNNCFTGKQSIKWTVAVYIKRHLNFRIGNALLNSFC